MSARVLPFERSEPLPGVRLVTESMPHVRSVSIGLWIDAGSCDEPEEQAGAAHFLEHLLFKGTARRTARDIANELDAIGGEINAYSAREHTCCYARVLGTDLHLAVDVLCDMFRNAALRDEDVESERGVVLEEIHMAADLPEERVHDVFAEAAWPSHALGRPIIGTEETIGRMRRADIESFYRQGYVPHRLVVAAAGDLTHEALAELLRRALDGGAQPWRRAAAGAPSFGAGRVAYENRPSEQVHLVWGFEALARDDPDRYALSVLSTLYGAGMSSRLFQEVREKRGLAYSIYSGEQLHVETGALSVYAGTQADNAANVLRVARDQAELILAGGLTPEEVGRAKGHMRGSLVLSMDDPGGRMTRLGRSELVHGEVLTVDDLLDRVDAVTTEDVSRVAKRVFSGSGPVLACVGPVAEGALDFAVEPLAN